MSNKLQDSQSELRKSLELEIFTKCEKPLEYVTKLCIADAEDGELRGMAVREYNPDVIKTRYSQELANQLGPFIEAYVTTRVKEAEVRGAKQVLSILSSEEGRIRQIANTVFYAAEYIAELEGVSPIPLDDFGDYHNYLEALTTTTNGKGE